jgi:PhoH-like ATPase
MAQLSDNRKIFVIDTNVLVHNPEAVNSFRDTEIAVPLTVLEELDKLKTYPDQRGRSAREAIRFLNAVIKGGDVRAGVRMENGSVLRVPFGGIGDPPPDLQLDKNDNRILLQAFGLQKSGYTVFFVSKDINARVKAAALGLKAVDYEKQKVDAASLYQGFREVEADSAFFDSLLADGSSPWRDRLYVNEFLRIRERGGERTALARWEADYDRLVLVKEHQSIFGVHALNDRQRAAIDLLLDDRVRCVTLVGRAGTGKTLLAVAAGLRKTLEDHTYARMLISRPVIPLGKDIGYLPGEKNAKMANWMEPIFDNMEYLLGQYRKPNVKSVDQLIRDRTIEIEAVTFIRGRSLPNQFIVVDEAQNLTPHEVKTIVSRAGENSKVVLTGDPYQIDNMYLDANSNGLTYLIDAFKGQRLHGHVTLQKTERSELAELAASIL